MYFERFDQRLKERNVKGVEDDRPSLALFQNVLSQFTSPPTQHLIQKLFSGRMEALSTQVISPPSTPSSSKLSRVRFRYLRR